MTREMGKVLAEARGDVQEAIDMSFYMAGEGRRLFGQTTPSELPRQVQHERAHADRRRRRDHAVELPDRDPVVEDRARRSSAATRSSSSRRTTRRCSRERFVELLVEAGVPAGVVNVVHGFGARRRRPDRPPPGRAGRHADRLARDRRRACSKAAADQLKHVHLELGGKNGIIVMDDADLDLAVEGIVWSAFGTSGQRCTAASRVIVHERGLRRARSRGSSRRRSGCASARAGSPTRTSAR